MEVLEDVLGTVLQMEAETKENSNTVPDDTDASISDSSIVPVQLHWLKMLCSLSHFGFNSRFLRIELKEEILKYLDGCGAQIDEKIRSFFI